MTDVKDLKPVEAKGLDLSQFEGSRVVIESAEIVKVPSKYRADENGEAEVLRVLSVPVASITDGDGKEQPIRASELFNLTRDKNGVFGWPEGPRGKLAGFLKKVGVSHPSKLQGKEAVIRVRRKAGADGTEREFLGFVTE